MRSNEEKEWLETIWLRIKKRCAPFNQWWIDLFTRPTKPVVTGTHRRKLDAWKVEGLK